MPFILTPSVNSEKVWDRYVLWPLHLDLIYLPIVLVTLLFGLVNAVQCIDNYDDPTNGATNSPTNSQAAAWVFHRNMSRKSSTNLVNSIFILLNILTPFVALVVSVINIYLYSTRSLNPVLSLITSIIMLGGWTTVLVWQGIFGPAGRWDYFNSRGLKVSSGVWIVLIVGGTLAGLMWVFVILLGHSVNSD